MDDLSVLKGQFLASLNHEIRTPLSGILGMADLLLETPLSDDQREYVNATRVCAENLLDILNVTLEFSALSANHIQLEEAEFSIRQVLEGLVGEFSVKATEKNLKFLGSVDRNLPESVVGDAFRVRQLISHLAANAIKFTNQGEVEIRASVAGAEQGHIPLTVVIRDTGIGIPDDKVAHLFDGFHSLETSIARNHHGLGLGLAVAQKLAVLLHATISVETKADVGSTFTIRLPLRLPTQQVAAVSPAGGEPQARILVVDDNSVAQTIASHALRRHAYKVVCAGDGPTALAEASKAKFDLILLDLQMPGWDGFETADRVRALPGYSDIPIVAVTANCSSDYRERCRQYRMQGFLAKPVRTKDLVTAVEQHLAGNAIGSELTDNATMDVVSSR